MNKIYRILQTHKICIESWDDWVGNSKPQTDEDKEFVNAAYQASMAKPQTTEEKLDDAANEDTLAALCGKIRLKQEAAAKKEKARLKKNAKARANRKLAKKKPRKTRSDKGTKKPAKE